MSIAVAFWAMGIGNSFTRFEKLEFVSIYVDTTTNQATAALGSVNGVGGITSIMVTNVGSGYRVVPSVSIASSGNGSGATARVTGLSNGIITGITITNAGSGYSMQNPPVITIASPAVTAVPSFPIYIQLKNTGSAAATINNVFLDGKPFSVVGATTNLISGTAQSTVLQVGQRRNDFYIYLPMGSTWSSGDYVEVEIQTSAGRQYSNTVLLP